MPGCTESGAARRALLQLLRTELRDAGSVLVYVGMQFQADETAAFLQTQHGIPASSYHAGEALRPAAPAPPPQAPAPTAPTAAPCDMTAPAKSSSQGPIRRLPHFLLQPHLRFMPTTPPPTPACRPLPPGRPLPERSRVAASFLAGATRVVVATVAFGMGVDHPAISAVVHLNMPRSVEDYVQQVGSRRGEGQVLGSKPQRGQGKSETQAQGGGGA